MLLTDYVALVSLTRDISTSHLLQVAAAVQKQVTRDFAPLWGIRATVDAFANLRTCRTTITPSCCSETLTSCWVSSSSRSAT